MDIVQCLSVMALRQVVDHGVTIAAGERTAESVARLLKRHFTDHSKMLLRALKRANDKSWRALEVALAGESLWHWLDSADRKAFSSQVRTFLDALPLDETLAERPEFRLQCLQDLRAARKDGLLDGSPDMNDLAGRIGEFAYFADPLSVLEAERQALGQVAEFIADAGYTTLARFVSLTPADDEESPLLVTAVRFFFRREIEIDPELFQGLAFDKLELLHAAHERAFTGLLDVFDRHGKRLDTILNSIQIVVLQTHDAVQEIRSEVEKLGQRLELLRREVRPRDSLSIHDDAERRLAKDLVARYRALPQEQRRRFPSLLNAVGKLELATGALVEAQNDFAEVAVLSADRSEQAEACFNRFGAALERGDYETALEALTKSAGMEKKYEPFPLRKYEPQKILGAGGFGVAFLCRNRLTGNPVVVKTLRRDTLGRDVKDVFREASMLEELDHVAVVRLRDCDYADHKMTRPYLVLDYFDGETLDEYVGKHGVLSVDELQLLIRPVAEALQAAHARNILHRDVKPGNLLVRKDESLGWQVKLIDFGLALKQNFLITTEASHCTVTGYSIAGTLDYAAPEQLGRLPGVAPGPFTDVYGLAKTCCFALFQTAQPLPKHWRAIPDDLADLLEQCLSETPAERLQDFAEFIKRLDALTGPVVIAESAADPVAKICQVAGDVVSDVESLPLPELSDLWQEAPAKTDPGLMQPIQRLTGHTDAVLSVAISQNGKYLLSGGADHQVRLWKLKSGETREFVGHTDKVWKVLFNPAQDKSEEEREWLGHAASAGKDKSVNLWNLREGVAVRVLPRRTNRSLALSPDGEFALTGNVEDGDIRYCDLQSGTEMRRLKGHTSWVLDLAFSPDGARALSASADGTVRLWNLKSGKELRLLQGHSDQVWSCAFSPDGRRALSGGADRKVRLWDLRFGRELLCLDDYRDQIWNVTFSPDGETALTDGDIGSLRLWDLATGRLLAAPKEHGGKVTSVAFSADGKLAASGSVDKTVVVWRVGV